MTTANQEIIAELRRVLNERDEAREALDLTKRELGRWVDRETKAVRERDLSLLAWESAGMTGRDAQSAMLELSRQLEAARAEIATLTAALDERDVEAERSLEQYESLVRERDEARDALFRADQDALRVEEERDRLREQLAAKHSECPDCADYAERSGRFAEQADQMQRERDEARASVADAYRRGAEAMREACVNVVLTELSDPWYSDELLQPMSALPIPEDK